MDVCFRYLYLISRPFIRFQLDNFRRGRFVLYMCINYAGGTHFQYSGFCFEMCVVELQSDLGWPRQVSVSHPSPPFAFSVPLYLPAVFPLLFRYTVSPFSYLLRRFPLSFRRPLCALGVLPFTEKKKPLLPFNFGSGNVYILI